MREFNVTGTCFKEEHYMVDTTNKLNQIMKLIEYGEYFVINRPRQYGKTTTLALLYQRLKDKYLVINLSFGKVSKEAYENTHTFSNAFYRIVRKVLVRQKEDTLLSVLEELKTIDTFDKFSRFITRFIKASDKEVILIIDEADHGTNNYVFAKFLATLRSLFLDRRLNSNIFKSVILACVHDVKNLDIPGEYISPWNIASEFKVDMSFNADEIETMLVDYNSEHNNLIKDTKYIAKRIHYFIA